MRVTVEPVEGVVPPSVGTVEGQFLGIVPSDVLLDRPFEQLARLANLLNL
jgi:hypothetical protein